MRQVSDLMKDTIRRTLRSGLRGATIHTLMTPYRRSILEDLTYCYQSGMLYHIQTAAEKELKFQRHMEGRIQQMKHILGEFHVEHVDARPVPATSGEYRPPVRLLGPDGQPLSRDEETQ